MMMYRDKLIVTAFFVMLSLFSCQKESETTTSDFITKINIESWNQKTYDFLEKKCDREILNLIKNDSAPIYLTTKNNDTLNSYKVLLDFYLKNRNIFLENLKKEISIFKNTTDALLVTEDFVGVYDPRVSYTVTSNNSKYTFIFYIESETLKKVATQDFDHRMNNYNSLIKKPFECKNQVQGIINSVSIESFFYINKIKEFECNLKSIYFGSLKID